MHKVWPGIFLAYESSTLIFFKWKKKATKEGTIKREIGFSVFYLFWKLKPVAQCCLLHANLFPQNRTQIITFSQSAHPPHPVSLPSLTSKALSPVIQEVGALQQVWGPGCWSFCQLMGGRERVNQACHRRSITASYLDTAWEAYSYNWFICSGAFYCFM